MTKKFLWRGLWITAVPGLDRLFGILVTALRLI